MDGRLLFQSGGLRDDRRRQWQKWPVISSGSRGLCSHLKHDFAWSVACSTVLERFACAGKRKHLG